MRQGGRDPGGTLCGGLPGHAGAAGVWGLGQGLHSHLVRLVGAALPTVQYNMYMEIGKHIGRWKNTYPLEGGLCNCSCQDSLEYFHDVEVEVCYLYQVDLLLLRYNTQAS